jgi:hypothetical protein
MHRYTRIRRFALAFAAVLAATVMFFVHNSAAAPRYFIFGPTTAVCDRTGQQVAAGYQDASFGAEAQGFWDAEPVLVSFTFPDGRVFSPVVTDDGYVNTPLGLDGVIDMPPNFPWVFFANPGGDYYNTFPTSNKWPYGCYTFTVHGLWSNREASSEFVVLPQVGAAPDSGPTTLTVEDNTTSDPSGQHGALVDLFGRGFLAREVISVWITAPDGTVLDYPQQQASDVGSFESTFEFTEQHQVGRYAFTALGTLSGYQVIAYFDLAARPSTPSGWAQLRVAFPYPANGEQRTGFEIQGKRFDPNERIDIWATLPDGSVRGLPSQFGNEYGEFFAVLYLDERLPTGLYHVTAKGADSGRLVIADLTLDEGSPNVDNYPPDPGEAPQVIESNTNDGTLGPGDNPADLPVLDPQPEPTF